MLVSAFAAIPDAAAQTRDELPRIPAQGLWAPAITMPTAARMIPAPIPINGLAALTPGQQCRAAIRAAERAAGVPEQLMAAIGRVESGRRNPDGSVDPWPWSINAEGTDHVFASKAEAVAAVKALQARGMRSIDVGCMQVNLMHHPAAFSSLEEAFDPVANARYAARFLVQLRDQTGAWPKATAWYHSATPEIGEPYQRRVMAVWPDELRRRDPSAGTRADLATAWAATRPAGSSGAGAVVSGPRSTAARVITMPVGTAGRSLSTYRAVPIPLATLAGPPRS